MRKTISIIVVTGIVLLIAFWTVSKYNDLASKDKACKRQWSIVANQYQRKLNIIPKLVNIIKDYALYEQEAFVQVTKTINQALQVKFNYNNITQENISELQTMQENIYQALQDLNVVAKRYPTLQTNQNFLDLQSQLKDTDNKIIAEHQSLLEMTDDFNSSIHRFPTIIIANLFGFEHKTGFTVLKEIENTFEIKL